MTVDVRPITTEDKARAMAYALRRSSHRLHLTPGQRSHILHQNHQRPQVKALVPGEWATWKTDDSGWWYWCARRVNGELRSGYAMTRLGARYAAKTAAGQRHKEQP